MPLHPQAQAFLDAIAAKHGPGWEQMTPDAARRVFSGLTDLFGAGPELPAVENRTIAGQFAIRVYHPLAGDETLPAIMFFHGGGWELGDLETHDALCRRLCQGSRCVVIAVDYRRPPEHPFPAAFADCFVATQYVIEHAQGFRVDAGRVAVCGDSAGGNLAAAVALRARDEGGPPLHSQWLVYPAIAPDFETASYRAYGEGYGLTRAAMEWFWRQYSPGPKERENSYLVPSRAATLAKLPRAYVITAEYDVLRDEGEDYAGKLAAAGVQVTTRRYNGMVHGFLHFSEAFDDGKRAVTELAQAIRSAMRV